MFVNYFILLMLKMGMGQSPSGTKGGTTGVLRTSISFI
jgi:hypothetical protein